MVSYQTEMHNSTQTLALPKRLYNLAALAIVLAFILFLCKELLPHRGYNDKSSRPNQSNATPNQPISVATSELSTTGS